MVDFVIAGHGRFASGVRSGIEMIFGAQERIGVIEFADGETKTELDTSVARVMAEHDGADGILVLCDVLQGSPFQALAAVAQADSRVRVVFGANVPMALECTARSMAGGMDVDELAAVALEAGRAGIGLFDPSTIANDCNEDDDWS